MVRASRKLFMLAALAPVTAFASQGADHGDPVASVVLALTIILVAAKLGGEVAVRLCQSAAPGELLVGVLLGNLKLFGFAHLDHLWTDPAIDMLARLGVLVLLLFLLRLGRHPGGFGAHRGCLCRRAHSR